MDQWSFNEGATFAVVKNLDGDSASPSMSRSLAGVICATNRENREGDLFTAFGCADDAEPRLFRGVFFGLILSTVSWAGVMVAIFC